jgi:hypothetical protein
MSVKKLVMLSEVDNQNVPPVVLWMKELAADALAEDRTRDLAWCAQTLGILQAVEAGDVLEEPKVGKRGRGLASVADVDGTGETVADKAPPAPRGRRRVTATGLAPEGEMQRCKVCGIGTAGADGLCEGCRARVVPKCLGCDGVMASGDKGLCQACRVVLP